MTHIICRLTAKNRDQLWNPTHGNCVWATFLLFYCVCYQVPACMYVLSVIVVCVCVCVCLCSRKWATTPVSCCRCSSHVWASRRRSTWLSDRATSFESTTPWKPSVKTSACTCTLLTYFVCYFFAFLVPSAVWAVMSYWFNVFGCSSGQRAIKRVCVCSHNWLIVNCCWCQLKFLLATEWFSNLMQTYMTVR